MQDGSTAGLDPAAAAAMDCVLHKEVEVADHVVLTGHVRSYTSREDHMGNALWYSMGRYNVVEDE